MIAILLNPASGVHRSRLREEVEELFRASGVNARIHLVNPHHIPDVAREALGARPEALVAGGGDGTVSAVASVLAGTSVPLGVLPLGTLNHFAKDAGIPLDLEKAVHIVAARRTRRVDLGRVNHRIFINNASIGVYPSLVSNRERLRQQGRSKWAAHALATIDVLRREDEVAIRLEGDRKEIVARTPFVFIGNNEYLVEGLKLGARARLDAGRLHAYFAPPVRTRDLPKLFLHALFGLARREHALESMAGAELWVDTLLTPTIDVACDGELVTLATPLHCRSLAGALTLLAPTS